MIIFILVMLGVFGLVGMSFIGGKMTDWWRS